MAEKGVGKDHLDEVELLLQMGEKELQKPGSAVAEFAKQITKGMVAGLLEAQENRKVKSLPPIREDIDLKGISLDNIEQVFRGLCPCFQGRIFNAKNPIFEQGGLATTVGYIREGIVALIHLAPNGKKLTFGLRFQGDLVGERALSPKTHYEASAVPLTKVRLCEIRGADLRAAVNKSPALALEMVEYFSRVLLERTEAILRFSYIHECHQRLAYALLLLAERIGESCQNDNKFTRIPLYISRTELGFLVGSSNKTIIRTLGDWAKRGWVKEDELDRLMIKTEEFGLVASTKWVQV